MSVRAVTPVPLLHGAAIFPDDSHGTQQQKNGPDGNRHPGRGRCETTPTFRPMRDRSA